MALIETGEATEGGNTTYLNFKAVAGPTDKKPYFCTTKDNGTGNYVEDKTYQQIGGVVTKVEQNQTTFNGQPVFAVKIILKDGEQNIVVSTTIKNASKGMLNAALGSIGKNVTFKAYLKKNGYPEVFCEGEDGERAKTFVDFKEATTEKLFAGATAKEEEKATITTEDVPF